MFKPPLLLTLSYLASVAIYDIAICFLLGQTVRSVEPGPVTLWAHGAVIGAGAFGVAAYWVMARRATREPKAAWFYLGGGIAAGLFLEGLVLLHVDYYMTRTFYLVSPTVALMFAGLVVMHRSLSYFEPKRPLSGRLASISLGLILAGSLASLRPCYIQKARIDEVAVWFFIANAVVCGLMTYRLFGVWLAKE